MVQKSLSSKPFIFKKNHSFFAIELKSESILIGNRLKNSICVFQPIDQYTLVVTFE